MIGFTNQAKAESEERKLLIELGKKLGRLESQGAASETVIEKWEYDKRTYPTSDYVETMILDHAALLRKWTKPWLERLASELNRGDGREILRNAEKEGKKPNFLKKLKNTVNAVYNWGIEEKLIIGVNQSPVYGLEVEPEKEEDLPEILSL